MKIEYLKEEIATYRELLKIFILIETAILGGNMNLALDFLRYGKLYELIFIVIGFVSFLVNLVIIKKIWIKMYEYKNNLRRLNG